MYHFNKNSWLQPVFPGEYCRCQVGTLLKLLYRRQESIAASPSTLCYKDFLPKKFPELRASYLQKSSVLGIAFKNRLILSGILRTASYKHPGFGRCLSVCLIPMANKMAAENIPSHQAEHIEFSSAWQMRLTPRSGATGCYFALRDRRRGGNACDQSNSFSGMCRCIPSYGGAHTISGSLLPLQPRASERELAPLRSGFIRQRVEKEPRNGFAQN